MRVAHGGPARYDIPRVVASLGAARDFLPRRYPSPLADILPELYADILKPPANVALDIFVEEPDGDAIDDRIAQLLITIALEAGL